MADVKMYQFSALISLGTGAQIRVYVSAPNQYIATQMLKAQYGAQLASDWAVQTPE